MSEEAKAQAKQFAEDFKKLSYGNQRYMEGLLDGMVKAAENATSDSAPTAKDGK